MKNKKKYIILLVCIIICVLLVSLFLINEEDVEFTEENLIFDCSKSTEANGVTMKIFKKMYQNNKQIKLVDGLSTKFESEFLKGETLNDYYEYQEATIKDDLEKKFGANYEYVEFFSEINAPTANFNIEYIVTEENKDFMKEKLNTKIFDISTKEILNQLEGEGFRCESF